MHLKALKQILLSLTMLLVLYGVSFAASTSQALKAVLQTATDGTSVGRVIVTFDTTNGLQSSHFATLQSVGILTGRTYPHLGMVAVTATAGQVRALLNQPNVLSVWSNDQLAYYNNETRVLTGVDKMRTDPNFIRMNGGQPVSGAKGGIAVLVNDSGIDGTHSDVHYPEHVIQNVQLSTQDDPAGIGFSPFLFVENVPNTDTGGHGTHCSGIVGGTGASSGGIYAGVAPGVNIIGVGSGAALFVLNSLGGFEYALANQYRYNIRVITNSWGPINNPPYNPNDPVNVASKKAHDLGIVVTFAGGNDGPVMGVFSEYAAAPWVIGVAAGTKEGGLASFSSRGLPKATRGNPGYNYAPTLVAPGTGREFASNASKFTAAVVSVRAKTNTIDNGLTSDTEIPLSDVPFYTQISGTSMATPFVAGTAALMLSVDPTLSPDDVKQILVETASQMPGYAEFEVGAGYINVYAAIDKVFNRNKTYGTYGGAIDIQQFNATFTVNAPPATPFHIDYNPVVTTGNSIPFNVPANQDVLDIRATVDTTVSTGNNLVGLVATDPAGNRYTSGITLPVIGTNAREIKVQFPMAGTWTLSVGGAVGLTTVPVRSPQQLAGPGPVDGTITTQQFVLNPVADIQSSPVAGQIAQALVHRLIDTFPDNTFQPDLSVTRGDFANALVTNGALRQSLANTAAFMDVTGPQEAIAEAVTAQGSTLRDYDFNHTALLSTQAGRGRPANMFAPTQNVSRLDVAVALVKALGLDDVAKTKAGTDVTVTTNGQTLVLADESQIPSDLRGYVQLALDRQILQAFFTLQQGQFDFSPTLTANFNPTDPVSRATLAVGLLNTRKAFVKGN
jgi:serine protease AprX